MSPRKSTKEKAQGRLLEWWERREEYGDAEGCISTTFTFDAPFYEEECLSRFVGMESHATEDGRIYLVEREERLAQITAVVMVDRSRVPTYRSLRWQVLPIGVPNGGILHSKVSLLVWQNRIRVLIGSANLTRPGYRRSYEQMAKLDYTADGDLPLAPLRSCLNFLESLLVYAPNQAQSESAGPKPSFLRLLESVRQKIATWTDATWPRGGATATLITTGPGRPPLFEQIRPLWGTPGPSDAFVLSPFYDERHRAQEVLDALMEILAARGERTIQFSASGRRAADGSIDLDLPSVYRTSAHSRCEHYFALVRSDGADGKEEHRPLHAKALWLEREVDDDVRALLVIGSSNFTCAGCGIGNGPVNIEANLAYTLPPSASDFRAVCKAAWPPEDDLDLDAATVNFLNPLDRETEGTSHDIALPAAFGMAIFTPEGEGGKLSLSIDAAAPDGFLIRAAEGSPLLSRDEWLEGGSEALVELSWTETRPPSHLLVSWTSNEGESLSGVWPINVSDAGLLPPPEELRNLRLDELLELLTSARPLHETLRTLLARREKPRASGEQSQQLIDPLRRVDSSRFLLRRMRAVSHALEGLRERLQRPISTMDALTWRLEGPVGAIALAHSLARDDPSGAAFMIAEVAFTVATSDWSIAERALGTERVREAVQRTVRALRELAAAQEAPSALRHYVGAAFQEIRA